MSVIEGQITNQQLMSGTSLATFIKKHKKIWDIFIFRACSLGYFKTISTPNEYGDKDEGLGRDLGPTELDQNIVLGIFTFPEVYEFNFKGQKP